MEMALRPLGCDRHPDQVIRHPHTGTAGPGRDSEATMSPFLILVILALLLTVVSLAWPKPFVLPVAVLLLAIALLIGGR